MASTSQYASTPNVGGAVITAALGDTRAVPTSVSTLITAGASGTIVTRAYIQNAGTGASAANVAAFYAYDGTTYYLIREQALPSETPSTSAAATQYEVVFNDLVLPTGWSLRAGIRVYGSAVDTTSITAVGADF